MDKIIIIAPHSKCVNLTERDCDTRAQDSAEKIYNIVKSHNLDVELLLSDELREDFDLNRAESRGTSWRRNLEDKVLKHYQNPEIRHIWIMEMHSFPRHSWEVENDEKMVFVAIPSFVQTAQKIKKYLGANIYLYQGTEKNDIQYSLAPFRNKVTVLLMEICEDRKYFTDGELETKLEKIVEYIKHNMSSNHQGPKWILEKTKYEFLIRITIMIILVLIILLFYMWDAMSIPEKGT